jgi:glucan 1,3-beta-glucosidase
MDRTIAALQVLTEEFTDPTYGDTIVAVELLNEPFPQQDWEVDYLKRFYQSAYKTVRAAAKQPNVVVAIDEAFQGLDAWNGFMTVPDWTDVALDTHIYAMFNLDTLAMGYNANLQWYCSHLNELVAANQQHWTIVGEFTRMSRTHDVSS